MDARSFLMGSNNPGFSFLTPGDRIVGKIVAEPTMQQQKKFGTNDPDFWPSGEPKMQMLVNVETSFRNYEGISTPDRTQPDTGARTIYVKGKHFEKACRDAIRASGAQWLDVGGWLECVFTGLDMTSKAGSKPKLFTVRYQPPATGPLSPAQPAQPNWQQPGWQPQSVPAAPSHHGSDSTMPTWATPVSAAPAPVAAAVSAPPAMSTLAAIRAAQNAGVFTDEPPF
jgi:hypothetical protein